MHIAPAEPARTLIIVQSFPDQDPASLPENPAAYCLVMR
jgi:hypothetical protein